MVTMGTFLIARSSYGSNGMLMIYFDSLRSPSMTHPHVSFTRKAAAVAISLATLATLSNATWANQFDGMTPSSDTHVSSKAHKKHIHPKNRKKMKARMADMSPEQREALKERMAKRKEAFKNMSPEEQKAHRDRMAKHRDKLKNMTPEQRKKAKARMKTRHQAWQKLSQEERDAKKAAFKAMTPEEKKAHFKKHRGH